MKAANLGLRFLLELAALFALGYWGAQRDASGIVRIGLAAALPVVAATFWGLFVAPKARLGGTREVRLALGLVVFFLASAAIVSLGRVTLGWTFGALALVNTVLTYAGGPQPGETSAAA
jgi:hypothetical protein